MLGTGIAPSLVHLSTALLQTGLFQVLFEEPGLETTQGAAAMSLDPALQGTGGASPSSCASRAAAQIVPVQPQSKCKRSESILTLSGTAQPTTAHPRGGLRSGKELGDVRGSGTAVGERRLRSRGCAWCTRSTPKRQGC